jgi:hypothetical protein
VQIASKFLDEINTKPSTTVFIDARFEDDTVSRFARHEWHPLDDVLRSIAAYSSFQSNFQVNFGPWRSCKALRIISYAYFPHLSLGHGRKCLTLHALLRGLPNCILNVHVGERSGLYARGRDFRCVASIVV